MNLDYLKTLKERSKLTLQQISDASGVPLNTLKKIYSGDTESPSFDSIASIVRAADGSLDEMAGYPAKAPVTDHHENVGLLREIISEKDKQIECKNKWISFCVLLCLIFIGIAILVLVYDMLHSDIGYLK